MAFSGSFICTSFKLDLLCGRMNFLASGGNQFKMSLHTNTATPMDATLTAYTTSGEHGGTGTYTATGKNLTNTATFPKVPSGVTAVATFDNLIWAASTITARGAVIYNDTITTPVADPSVCVLDFGADKSSSAGDFTVSFPPSDAANAIIRIA